MKTPRRIEPIGETDNDELRALLVAGRERSGLDVVPDFYGVLANHPELLQRILGSGIGRMPDGALSVRYRELLVLRTARHCRAVYEWAHHTRRAVERGLDDNDVRLAWEGAATSAVDRILLRVADDLHEHSTIDDDVWSELRDTVGERAAIEAIAVVGWFHFIAFLGNGLGLAVEPDVDATFGPSEVSS